MNSSTGPSASHYRPFRHLGPGLVVTAISCVSYLIRFARVTVTRGAFDDLEVRLSVKTSDC